MIKKFKFEHGIFWLAWVVIIFTLMIIVFFVGVWDNFIIVLESFGFQSNDDIKHAFFWLFVSLMFLTALRGAKCQVTLSK